MVAPKDSLSYAKSHSQSKRIFVFSGQKPLSSIHRSLSRSSDTRAWDKVVRMSPRCPQMPPRDGALYAARTAVSTDSDR